MKVGGGIIHVESPGGGHWWPCQRRETIEEGKRLVRTLWRGDSRGSRSPFAFTENGTDPRYANVHDVDKGGHYDARSAAINVWSHHWLHPATHAESDTIGSFYFHWEPPVLWEIECDEGFNLDDLMAEFGRLELQALGRVNHGNVP
jgi:hypothetical protein